MRIIFSETMKENVIEVRRVSGRRMCLKIKMEKGIANVVSAYTPQVGCTEEEKETFFEELQDLVRVFGVREYAIIGANLNALVGRERAGFERHHGGNGYGNRNSEGVRIFESVEAMNMVIGNT